MAKAKTVEIPSRTELDIKKVNEMVQRLVQEARDGYLLNKLNKETKMNKTYAQYDNNNEPILYIILNKDAIVDEGVRLTAISHLTSMMSNKLKGTDEKIMILYSLAYQNEKLWKEWLDSFDGYGNTVILEVSEDELYDNCMSDYDNVAFVKYIDDSERVAHHNWKLDIPQHIGIAFFGIKSEMPKWVRKLPLYK